jgi:hypothetical protein
MQLQEDIPITILFQQDFLYQQQQEAQDFYLELQSLKKAFNKVTS